MLDRVPWTSELRHKRQASQRQRALGVLGLIAFAALPLLVVGCAKGSQAPATQEATAPSPTALTAQAPTPTPVPTTVATTPPEAADEIALPETLFLDILEPADESIVEDAPVALIGRTTPDAVVSVNGEAAEVNAEGQFVALVSLEPGPNVIEVVASDLAGEAESAVLAIIYLP